MGIFLKNTLIIKENTNEKQNTLIKEKALNNIENEKNKLVNSNNDNSNDLKLQDKKEKEEIILAQNEILDNTLSKEKYLTNKYN